MDLLIWIYISLTVFVDLSHTSTTLPTSTTDITDGVTSVELASLEVTSITMTTEESPTLATSSAIIAHSPSITASGDVSAFYTSTALPTNKTDNSGNASTSGIYLSTLSTITQEVTQPPATTTTTLSKQTPVLTLPGEVSAFYTSTALPTNKTDNSGNASTSGIYLSTLSTITQEVTQPPATTTTTLSKQTPVLTLPGEVSAFYTSTALPTNKTDNSGNASTSGIYLSTLSTITQEVTQPPATTTTTLSKQTPVLTLPGEGKEVKSNVVLIIIVVVITVIGTTAIIVVILILYTRRHRKRAAREDSKPDLATHQPFSTYESFRESNLSYAATDTLQWNNTLSAAVDASNHDRKNDETTIKCYNSVKKQKNRKEESGDRRNYRGDVMADEYKMKDIRIKSHGIMSNYDNLPVTEEKANNGNYSQVTNQSESILASIEDEKSLCKHKKNSLVVDYDSNSKITITGEEYHVAGDYSYVNPDIGLIQENL